MKTLNDFVGHHYAPGYAPDMPGSAQGLTAHLTNMSMSLESFAAILRGMSLLYLVLARTNRRMSSRAGGGRLIRDLERETRMRAFRDAGFELRLRQAGGQTDS